jgi:hypothetical protein
MLDHLKTMNYTNLQITSFTTIAYVTFASLKHNICSRNYHRKNQQFLVIKISCEIADFKQLHNYGIFPFETLLFHHYLRFSYYHQQLVNRRKGRKKNCGSEIIKLKSFLTMKHRSEWLIRSLMTLKKVFRSKNPFSLFFAALECN